MDRFIRRENVKHYRQMLAENRTGAQRDQIKKLLAEEEQKQADAGDFAEATDKRDG